MSRISIDVTGDEHKRLKALAALKGVTLKEYMLQSALEHPGQDEEEALAELEALLQARIKRAKESGPARRQLRRFLIQWCAGKRRGRNDGRIRAHA